MKKGVSNQLRVGTPFIFYAVMAGGSVQVEGGGVEGVALLVGYNELELAAVVVEILHLELMETFGEGFLSYDFAGAVGAVVVNHCSTVDYQQAAVVAEKRKGIDAVGGDVDIAVYNQTDVAFAVSRNCNVGHIIFVVKFCRGDFGAFFASVVIPFGYQTQVVALASHAGAYDSLMNLVRTTSQRLPEGRKVASVKSVLSVTVTGLV